MFALWSRSTSGNISDFMVLPWHKSTRQHPEHWPSDIGKYWIEARRSIEAENWIAAALMARSAIQLIVRAHGGSGSNLKQEIDDLADKGLLIPIMKDWSHEVRNLGNEGTHPKPGGNGTDQQDAIAVVEFLNFMLKVLYDLPHSIEKFRQNKKAE